MSTSLLGPASSDASEPSTDVSDERDVDEGDWIGELAGEAVDELLAEEAEDSDGSGLTSEGASLLRAADCDAILKGGRGAGGPITAAPNHWL